MKSIIDWNEREHVMVMAMVKAALEWCRWSVVPSRNVGSETLSVRRVSLKLRAAPKLGAQRAASFSHSSRTT
jgi:hypothetical protein